ncbi:helix-turn-helix domain-containing protein [Pseudoalteromonas peptidolytica]|uniref:helix-turn-helix domain-containing protein n=1 Tax=Pseudoalteromonas peptidolytica TaxID=61150 RepID=UPI00298D83C8|nr:helix-turn-helix transcriptional regulator [Pseudoalteromonas peptidolytica]MDW7549823.1 helix-turn-helix transcriptional regulator [Pseudoalteromonas peptidolytica]
MQFENPIPKRLKEARKKAGYSQKALGVRIGMDESSASGRMNHYEKGRHTPDLSTLKRIADELGVPINYFFCEDDKMAEIVCLLDKLNEKNKESVLKVVQEMIASSEGE